MAGVLDDWFGVDPSNQYNPWLAAIAANQAAAQQQAAAAAQQQEAANAAAQQQAAAAAAAVPAPAPPPVGTPPDLSPYRALVDAGFSQFTPEWYANQYQAVYNPYKSGVEQQYGTAKDYLTAGLAKKGQTNAPFASGLFQQLDALKDQELTKGQSQAQDYQGGLESQVSSAKDSLYGSITPGGSSAELAANTSAAANPIYGTKAPSSTLGENVFGSIVDSYGTAPNPSGPALSFGAKEGSGGLNLAGGAGGPEASAKVVGGTPTTPKKKKF